ncbi:Tex family protein [Caldalkalibacillus salinus]|uniref:Tex family protein n=1 Tax=Caldalkalibacillus salinus TaxID=2803787 RepID=UPI001924B304|nr:Tex family protein [Caldalkalibacillus salinus]
MRRQIQQELQLNPENIKATVNLLDEGNTVPFIARYRKELTGSLDEEQIRAIEERMQYLRGLAQRKEEVLRLIDEQGKLTENLKDQILHAKKLQEVEDYYRPYKQKRRTKATIAKEKGLEPLAHWLLEGHTEDPQTKAADFLSDEHGIESEDEALQGAKDIIAEMVSDQPESRKWIRHLTFQRAQLVTKQKNEEEDGKNVYEMYYDYQEPLHKVPPHRILAMNRGEKEDILRVAIQAPTEDITHRLAQDWVKDKQASPSVSYVKDAVLDSYKRLIAPSIEREVRKELTEKAEEQAIEIFAKNVKSLLLQPPVRGRYVLGIDPAYRTGCKWAIVDPTGKMLDIGVIYPTPPRNEVEKARKEVLGLLEQYPIDIIAIGNGTASRETEQFVAETIKAYTGERQLSFIIINEAGASVYSASALAKEEFPDLDVAERSAISIARRLQDPLAELVKIDPKSIGVGQYQHDVSQSRLSESLTFVVESAVNQVGVDVNTASASLLQYVSGLNKSVANQVVKYREKEGLFKSRKQLLKVPRLGAKTFEQAVGFLRVFDGEDPLDQTPIHTESYQEADMFLKELGFKKDQVGSEALIEALDSVNLQEWANKLNLGLPTLTDIVQALQKPRRDPRDQLTKPLLQTDVLQLEHLKEGMQLEGTVRNVVDFGAFVDIGLKNDGLVHISKMSKRYVSHPMDVVSVGDIVTVWVTQVDQQRGRVGLSMLPPDEISSV